MFVQGQRFVLFPFPDLKVEILLSEFISSRTVERVQISSNNGKNTVMLDLMESVQFSVFP